MKPEDKARIVIDKKLEEAGYLIQDMSEFNPYASLGIAVREYPTDTGPADYIIFIDGIPCGVIEAKEAQKGDNLSTAEAQAARYATSKLKWVLDNKPLRFRWASTDELTFFADIEDIDYRSRRVFSFFQPETLKKWLKEGNKTLRNNLKLNIPTLQTYKLRDCQFTAINNLEKSFRENKPRALIQMATGAGKTYTAVTSVYRLLKFAKAKRILFLVDTKNLGKQAEGEFRGYKPQDDSRLFTELYNIQRLTSSSINDSSQVCISTIQRMYSILKGEELDDSLEDDILTEKVLGETPKEVVYNKKYPNRYTYSIIIDECHRSIYNLWQQVLDYFDAFLIGLTATPDSRTFAFFNQNVVSEYSREKAIIDGVNVGEDKFIIETDKSKNGGYICKQIVEKRERLTRRKRWEQLDEDIDYDKEELDKTIVVPDQIRLVLETFKNAVEQIYPERKELPKTLIFAKDDSHAEDIVRIAREVFGKGDEFCQKITYSADRPEDALKEFRNGLPMRIAVTVNMIATGTDVKPLECLLFMRDVKSKNFFEQMLGRGTRVLDLEELQRVSPSAKYAKDRFILFDAVGITKSVKSDTRSLERNPGVSFKDLVMRVALGSKDEDTITSLSNRLLRLDAVIDKQTRTEICNISGNLTPSQIAENLLNCFDEDYIVNKVKEEGHTEVTEDDIKKKQEQLLSEAVKPIYDPKLREKLLSAKKKSEQIISDEKDVLVYSGWDDDYEKKAEETITSFKQFIDENKDKLDALQIIYNQMWTKRFITYSMIEELSKALEEHSGHLTIRKLNNAYYVKYPTKMKGILTRAIDIISLVKYEWGLLEDSNSIAPFSSSVNYNFKEWVFERNSKQGYIFTEEQMKWLRAIRDSIGINGEFTPEDLEFAPFDKDGGLGKFFNLFGNDYQNLLTEMNTRLMA